MVCIWGWAMSRAREILMTLTPAVCFTSSTALIRREPLCSTARLINEAQPCAAAETYTHSFKHIHSGQANCVGGLRAAYTHRKYTRSYILRTLCCPFPAVPVNTNTHTYMHILGRNTIMNIKSNWLDWGQALHHPHFLSLPNLFQICCHSSDLCERDCISTHVHASCHV